MIAVHIYYCLKLKSHIDTYYKLIKVNFKLIKFNFLRVKIWILESCYLGLKNEIQNNIVENRNS